MDKNKAVSRWASRWSVSLQRLGQNHYRLYRGAVEGVEFSPKMVDRQRKDMPEDERILLWLGMAIKEYPQLRQDLKGALAEKKCFEAFEEIFNE